MLGGVADQHVALTHKATPTHDRAGRSKRRRQQAEHPYVVKFASDAELSHDVVYALAEAANMQVVPFIKWAYSDVPAFINFLKAAGEGRVKAAGGTGSLLAEALGHLKNMGEGGLKALTSHGGSSLPGRDMFMEGGRGLVGTFGNIGKEMVGTPFNKTPTVGGLGAGAASLGMGGGAGVRGLMGGGPKQGPQAAPGAVGSIQTPVFSTR
jgi:hypothetical protein